MRTVLRGALLLCALSTALPASADVFINELHYDDADTPTTGDTNEAIEVVATGGEDLTQYSIVLYNGATASAAITYDTDAVPAGAVVSCAGGSSARIAVLNYAVNGIQNGAPDAIALVQGATVVQFLSYEGVATASNGPAAGLVSTDIGVSEISATVEGTSLQLGGGPSSTYAGFAWQPSATATMGACNNGQTFGAPVDNPPQLSSSNPANGATGVAPTANVVLTFSEAVTTTDPWFVLDCGAGAVAGLISGSGASRTFDPNLSLPSGATCSATLTPANVVDTDGTPDALSGTSNFSFTVAVDSAPTVASVSPLNGASGVNASANLAVTFSEAVTPTLPNWLTLTCANSGTHTVTISGGPTAWTLNPDSDFGFSELCTGTIAAANVVDQDGLPDPMAAPFSWSFTTAADLAPTVNTTTPTDNAINVSLGSDITVVFSEPVAATTASFTISCASSGAHSFVLSAAPAASYTLNPDADFTATEVCTVTVVAAQVTDTDGAATPMAVDHVFDFTTGNAPGDYYAGVDASTCVTLRSTLHDKIDDHTAFPYSHATLPDTWTVLEAADQDPLSASSVLEVYENASYAKAGGGNSNYNREHTWPNSYGFNNLSGVNGSGVPQSSAYVDTHMLYLSDIEYNSNRGSKPYANCPDTDGCSADVTLAYNGFGGGAVTYASGNHNWKKTAGSEAFGSYEVWNHRKGDMARAVLYMDIRYEGGTATGGNTIGQSEPDLIVTDDRNQILSSASSTTGPAYMGLKSTLLAWHQADPPDAHELLRNDVVFSFQGNRNPFIDHPEWAECLFNCNCLPASNPPTATADNANINEDSGANTILVLANDPDPDGGPKLVQSVTQPSGGTVTIGPAGAHVVFTPNANFCASTSFSYTLNGGSSATVSISMTCSNDAPNAVGTLSNQSYPEGTLVSLGTASGFNDVDGDVLTYTATGLPATLAIGLNDGLISGTLQNADIGVHTVVVTARDPSLAQATQSFTITVTALPAAIFGDGFE